MAEWVQLRDTATPGEAIVYVNPEAVDFLEAKGQAGTLVGLRHGRVLQCSEDVETIRMWLENAPESPR